MFRDFEDGSRFGKEAVDNGLKSLAAVTKGVQAIAAEAADYSKKAIENGSATIEKLFSVKSPEKAFEIQADYLKQSYEGFVAQSAKMSNLFAELAKDAYQPFEQTVAKTK